MHVNALGQSAARLLSADDFGTGETSGNLFRCGLPAHRSRVPSFRPNRQREGLADVPFVRPLGGLWRPMISRFFRMASRLREPGRRSGRRSCLQPVRRRRGVPCAPHKSLRLRAAHPDALGSNDAQAVVFENPLVMAPVRLALGGVGLDHRKKWRSIAMSCSSSVLPADRGGQIGCKKIRADTGPARSCGLNKRMALSSARGVGRKRKS